MHVAARRKDGIMISGVKAISEAAATFSGKYGQSTAVAIFEDVFVPWEANGLDLDQAPYLREAMVELIKIVEGFYASEWPLRCTQRRPSRLRAHAENPYCVPG